MNLFKSAKKSSGTNEFNQEMKAVSLHAEAWKRLKKNKNNVD